MLFTLLAERYEGRSVMVTSNLVFSQWDRIFRDPMATAAAIDRLVHHAVVIEFDVPSYRTNRSRRKSPPAPAPPKLIKINDLRTLENIESADPTYPKHQTTMGVRTVTEITLPRAKRPKRWKTGCAQVQLTTLYPSLSLACLLRAPLPATKPGRRRLRPRRELRPSPQRRLEIQSLRCRGRSGDPRRLPERTIDLAGRRGIQLGSVEERLNRHDLDPRVPSPRRRVRASTRSLRSHGLRRVPQANKRPDRGFFPLDDAAEFTHVVGARVPGLHGEHDLPRTGPLDLVEVPAPVDPAVRSLLGLQQDGR